MPHTDAERSLRVQLATALRERDTEREFRGAAEAAFGEQLARTEAAESERDAARAEVKRLTEALVSPLEFRDAEWAAALGLTDMCKPACLQDDSSCPGGLRLRAALATGGDRG